NDIKSTNGVYLDSSFLQDKNVKQDILSMYANSNSNQKIVIKGLGLQMKDIYKYFNISDPNNNSGLVDNNNNSENQLKVVGIGIYKDSRNNPRTISIRSESTTDEAVQQAILSTLKNTTE
ncbi:MAG: hypothetical protein RSB66_08265, partial [Clostridium sp.]